MRRVLAAVAVVAILFAIGCQDTKKLTALQGQVDQQQQQITQLTSQVGMLTAERDSLQKVLTDMAAKKAPATKVPAAKPVGKPSVKK